MNQQLKRWLTLVIPWVLALMTVIVLVSHIPQTLYVSEALVYMFLTALALYFGVWLADGSLISPAHVIGMIALLSLPETAVDSLLWAMFSGGLLGAAGLLVRGGNYALPVVSRTLIFSTGRVTLSFFAAGQVYIALGGVLPLSTADWAGQIEVSFDLLVYSLVYTTLYLAVFVLQVYVDQRPIQRIMAIHFSLIIVVLVLPIPFAILGASLAGDFLEPAVFLSRLGLVVIILGLHALSRSDNRLRRQITELHKLAETTRSMRSQLDLDTLTQTIYRQVAELLNIQNFTIMLYGRDRSQPEMSLAIRDGKVDAGGSDTLLRAYDNTLSGHVLETGQPLLISHNIETIAQTMRLQPPRGELVAWMGVPLVVGERNLGVMAVASDDPSRRFDQNDLRLFTIVADSASVAIENAQLYNQQVRRVEQMVTLNNIVTLLSGTLSPENVLDTVISSASALTEAYAVAVYLFQDDITNVPPVMVRSAGLSPRFVSDPPIPMLVQDTSRPLPEQMPLAINDIMKDPRTIYIRDLMRYENQVSLVEVSLSIGETSLGVLVLYFQTVQQYGIEQIEMLRTFATQAAQAISNARIYTSTDEAFQRSVEQLLVLSGIGRMLTSTIDLAAIGELVLENAIEATHGQAGLVALFNEDSTRLQLIAQQGYPAGRLDQPDALWQGVSRRVLSTGQAVHLDDVHRDPDYVARLPETVAEICVPIIRGTDVMGYVMLESTIPGAFSAEDLQFVAQIANQAVVAINNARLFANITQARDRLQIILDTINEAIALINDRGQVILVNPRIEMLGLKPDNLLNRFISDLIDTPNLNLVQAWGFESAQMLADLVHNCHSPEHWNENQVSDSYVLEQGSRFIQRNTIPIPGKAGYPVGIMLVFYDNTEEQELAQAREELSRMIVHDLRSPLTAVTTSLKLLHDLVPRDSDFAQSVQMTTDASRRAVRKLLSRVDSLLDVSKMESGRLGIDRDIVELPPLVENVRDELRPLADELEIELKTELADIPLLNVDGDKVERLLLNLVDNALKYSPTESDVTIRAVSIDDGFAQIDVIDNGPGVPDDYKDVLFDRFVQVEGRKKVRRGVGLGLTFCKLVAEAHGGRIWVENNPTGGSIFSFTVPVADMSRFPDDEGEDL
jgi:two-component system, NtrC family, sensor histidine kinase KinB